jgi:hypothetical protein
MCFIYVGTEYAFLSFVKWWEEVSKNFLEFSEWQMVLKVQRLFLFYPVS